MANQLCLCLLARGFWINLLLPLNLQHKTLLHILLNCWLCYSHQGIVELLIEEDDPASTSDIDTLPYPGISCLASTSTSWVIDSEASTHLTDKFCCLLHVARVFPSLPFSLVMVVLSLLLALLLILHLLLYQMFNILMVFYLI